MAHHVARRGGFHRWPRGARAIALGAAIATVAVVGSISAWAIWGKTHREPSATLIVPISDLTPLAPRHYTPDFLGISPLGEHYGVWVVLRDDGNVDAFFDRDPYSYCLARWLPDSPVAGAIIYSSEPPLTPPPLGTTGGHEIPPGSGAFRVGCTGWTFDIEGVRVFGAAPRGLDRFHVSLEDDEAVIDLRQVQLGSCGFFPSDARPDCSTADRPVFAGSPPAPSNPTYGFPHASAAP